MKKLCIMLAVVLSCLSCRGQQQKAGSGKRAGGPCEGCEAVYEYGRKKLLSVDTLPAFRETGPKIKVYGTVFKKDGHTPAKDVIVYIYHTNREGIYPTRGDESGWGKRHGYIRGWVKTGEDGQYAFYTFRPGAYPNAAIPEHIHITVKEPGRNEYYMDEFLFDDDPLLTGGERKKLENRGGSGIVKPVSSGGMLVVKRDIVLGLNIPAYE